MDIFVRNLPESMTEKQLTRYFSVPFSRFGLATFQCTKAKGKKFATVTVLDVVKGNRFLSVHGQIADGIGKPVKAKQQLWHMNLPVYCQISRDKPDRFLISSLQRQEKASRPINQESRQDQFQSGGSAKRSFSICQVSIGQLDYERDDLIFVKQYQQTISGSLTFTSRQVFVTLHQPTQNHGQTQEHHLEIPYSSIQSYIASSKQQFSLTLSLFAAPRIFRKLTDMNTLQNFLASLGIDSSSTLGQKGPQVERQRVRGLDGLHEAIISSCLCYRFRLLDPQDMGAVYRLKKSSEVPSPISMSFRSIFQSNLATQLKRLQAALSDEVSPNIAFNLKFQMHKLALNGYLSPEHVLGLFESLKKELNDDNADAYVDAIRQMMDSLPFRGPGAEASDFTVTNLIDTIRHNVTKTQGRPSFRAAMAQYEHIIWVHKAMVTPAGIYLDGPTPEVKNRVLRRYSPFPNHFISVSFREEDGEMIRSSTGTSNATIYKDRFKKILDNSITIAGRHFEVMDSHGEKC